MTNDIKSSISLKDTATTLKNRAELFSKIANEMEDISEVMQLLSNCGMDKKQKILDYMKEQR